MRERHEHDEDEVVRRVLAGIPGVQDAVATSTGITITYDPERVTPAQIRTRLIELGYVPQP